MNGLINGSIIEHIRRHQLTKLTIQYILSAQL